MGKVKALLTKVKNIFAVLRSIFKRIFCWIKEHKLRTVLTVLAVLFVLVGVVVGIVFAKLHSYYQQSNYVESTPIPTKAAKAIEEPPEEEEDEEMREIKAQMEKYRSEEPITTDGNVYNILLVGIDKVNVKKNNENGANSDSMILVSLNYETKEINMISLMRDTYVHVPGIGNRKLNAAYSNGEAPLLLETITENFKIQVDRYIVVAFKDMVNIIDLIGNITIEFSDKEALSANETIKTMCENMGMKDKIEEYQFTEGGVYECNGIQAVAYARIRKVGNADYQRTERQREVLAKIFTKLKQMRIEDLDRLANKLLPNITHNVPESEYWGLIVKAPEMLSYDLKQERIPYDNMFHSRNGSLVPQWDDTVVRLKETLYGPLWDVTPTPTETPILTATLTVAITPTPMITSTPQLTPRATVKPKLTLTPRPTKEVKITDVPKIPSAPEAP